MPRAELEDWIAMMFRLQAEEALQQISVHVAAATGNRSIISRLRRQATSSYSQLAEEKLDTETQAKIEAKRLKFVSAFQRIMSMGRRKRG